MSVNQKSNFNIVGFFIADYPPVSTNQVLYVQYIEDIRSATTLMDAVSYTHLTLPTKRIV